MFSSSNVLKSFDLFRCRLKLSTIEPYTFNICLHEKDGFLCNFYLLNSFNLQIVCNFKSKLHFRNRILDILV